MLLITPARPLRSFGQKAAKGQQEKQTFGCAEPLVSDSKEVADFHAPG
jgi:hypothetical protein